MQSQPQSQEYAREESVPEPPGCHGYGEVSSGEGDELETLVDPEINFFDHELSVSESLLDIPFRISQPKPSSYYVVFAAVLAALGGVLFGYDVGEYK